MKGRYQLLTVVLYGCVALGFLMLLAAPWAESVWRMAASGGVCLLAALVAGAGRMEVDPASGTNIAEVRSRMFTLERDLRVERERVVELQKENEQLRASVTAPYPGAGYGL